MCDYTFNIFMLKYLIKKLLFNYSLRFYGTTMFLPHAKKYINHLKYCRKLSKINTKKNKSAEQFLKNGFCAFNTQKSKFIAKKILKHLKIEEKKYKQIWDKDTGKYLKGDIFQKFPYILDLFNSEIKELINQIYKSNFSIFYGILYKSSFNGKKPSGSQLWHVDGGPGTCINLMYCLSEISPENGSMKCLSWENSKYILRKLFKRFEKLNINAKYHNLDKVTVRKEKSMMMRQLINENFRPNIFQPQSEPGLVYAFKNNCVHSGGYPLEGFERYVCVFHIYPNEKKFDPKKYIQNGIIKTSPYPKDPFLI